MPVDPATILMATSFAVNCLISLYDRINIGKTTFYNVIYVDIKDSPKLCYAIEQELKLNGHLPTVYSDMNKEYKEDEKWKIKYENKKLIEKCNNDIDNNKRDIQDFRKDFNKIISIEDEQEKKEQLDNMPEFVCRFVLSIAEFGINSENKEIKKKIKEAKQKITIEREKDRYLIKLGRVYGYDGILIDFVKDILTKHYIEKQVCMYYLSNNSKWQLPIVREARNVDKLIPNKSMNKIFCDMIEFSKMENKYYDNGQPYRRGYLLYGKPGVGKSTIIEAIASFAKMDVFEVILNSKDMTDSVLINLVANVPPKSLIVFEELDMQLKSIKKNNTINVSESGILSAIDGPHRLAKGTIVIVTCNDPKNFTPNFKEKLVRPGRIDIETEIL